MKGESSVWGQKTTRLVVTATQALPLNSFKDNSESIGVGHKK